MPRDLEALFCVKPGADGRYFLSFKVGDVVLDCHFFTLTEVEFSFEPGPVTETSLGHLLAFMIDMGEVTRKTVTMTSENFPQSAIFKYDSNELRWIPPE